ncbi:MAG TPA: right-handed parallel beta-helix repeat-containing protein [Candidatus Eisenbacteria bacterium]|nr:right-handed parallel beta-helix repeat-containing protein [Candidatus Eisenbacteria bacterium]
MVRSVLAVLGTLLALGGGTPASATSYFVDGACNTSGTGTALACGASGPFRTIGEGIEAMAPGDTLNVRGAHGAFDGAYFEQLSIENGSALPGQGLACTAGQPCVIQGCRAPACPTDEQPTIRGMTLRGDWVAQGGGVWRRTMEATPEDDGQSRDVFEPNMIMQATGTPMTMLAYAGDNDAAPAPGEWSYHPATHVLVVNPLGGANPAAQIYVPHFSYNVHIARPTRFLTLQYLTFEGTRGRGIEAGQSAGPGSETPGLVLRHLVQRYVTRHFILGHALPGVLIEDNLAEHGCRGWSFANPQSDGCFGYRLFDVPGGMVRRNVVRHIGGAGRRRFSGQGGWPCDWCDPPWNDPNHTDVSAFGVGIQIKQTEGATVEDNVTDDLEEIGIGLDVSRSVVVRRNTITRVTRGIGMRNYTPTSGCPTTDPSEFCYNSDHVIDGNVIDDVGFGGDVTQCGIFVNSGGRRHDGSVMLARITNNLITNSPTAGICVINEEDSLPIPELTIEHNTIRSSPRGLIVRDPTQNVRVQSNLFTQVAEDALLVTSAALPGMLLDGDSVGPGTSCPVRWRVPTFNTGIPDTGGTCDTLAEFAAANPPDEASGPDPNAGAGGVSTTTTSTTRPTTTSTSSTTRPTTSSTSTSTTTTTSTRPPTTITTSTTRTTTTSTTSTSTRPTTSTTRTTTSTTRPSTTTTRGSTSSTTSSSAPSTTSSSGVPTTGVPTTDTPTSSTTSTTTPDSEQLLTGKNLLLKEGSGKPGARRFRMLSTDQARLTLGDPADIMELVGEGGSLRIVAVGGDGFSAAYRLGAARWHLLKANRPSKGVYYADRYGPITKVQFVVGKRLLVQGKGAELEQSLAVEPSQILVELRIGSRSYCLSFGGDHRQFDAQSKLLRSEAAAPAACPDKAVAGDAP